MVAGKAISARLDTKGYEAAKHSVRDLKLQVTPPPPPPSAAVVSFTKTQQSLVRSMDTALTEHVVIIRTSGLRPGRENILVEHVDLLRSQFHEALERLHVLHDEAARRWKSEMAAKVDAAAADVDTLANALAEREQDMEQHAQEVERRHFEELEALTQRYDDKVVDIQALCDDKIAQVERASQGMLHAMRDKMKMWKVAFEAKVKDVVQGKIDGLQSQSERELKVVMTQMDKEAQALVDALQAARQQITALERDVATLKEQVAERASNVMDADTRWTASQEALAHAQAQANHFQHMYETLLATMEQLRDTHAQEKVRLVQQHAMTQESAERAIEARHQAELATLHDRVRHAVDKKSSVIAQLETQLADAVARAHSTEHVLMQLSADLQSCGSQPSGAMALVEAFHLDD
ncbi:Aste57867_23058 [Aphanomyces stellatus]|uniref:Aste57867_23058 protein n=1 Tax=Aphanomyces stellatus TaxID=120398 RepID=A0A485LM69_9STRA|nr:hypothetical protein As57867_022987 [Aphanomyces stellatus]VFT99706.1 Aste57867_23058 [Aphanomyces stellatus]